MLDEKQYRYPELARKTGLASLLSVPLISRDKVIGTINIYTRDSAPVHRRRDRLRQGGRGAGRHRHRERAADVGNLEMKRTLEARKLMERAKGILQHKHNLTEEEAYLRLRNESRRLRRSMRDLAEAVILADDLERKQK